MSDGQAIARDRVKTALTDREDARRRLRDADVELGRAVARARGASVPQRELEELTGLSRQRLWQLMETLEQCPECGTRVSERMVKMIEGPKVTQTIDRYLDRATCVGCGAALMRMHRGEPWLLASE